MAWLTPTPLMSCMRPSATSGKDAQLSLDVHEVGRVFARRGEEVDALVDEIA